MFRGWEVGWANFRGVLLPILTSPVVGGVLVPRWRGVSVLGAAHLCKRTSLPLKFGKAGPERPFRNGSYNSVMTTQRRRWHTIRMEPIRRHRRNSFARQVAYACRNRIDDTRTGHRHNYSQRGQVDETGSLGWNGSDQSLATAASEAERERKKAVEGRTLIVDLPRQFNAGQRRRAVTMMARYLMDEFRVAVVWAIHPPPPEGDDRNWHAHLVFTSRRVIDGCRLGLKTRVLDDYKTGGPAMEKLREWWTTGLNRVLEGAGFEPELEHKSFLRMGIAREPTSHRGPRRIAIERREQRVAERIYGRVPRVGGQLPPLLNPVLAPLPVRAPEADVAVETVCRENKLQPATPVLSARTDVHAGQLDSDFGINAVPEVMRPRPPLNIPRVEPNPGEPCR